MTDILDTLAPVPPMAAYATWERWAGDCGEYVMDFLIAPGTDLDSTFRAWDIEESRMTRVNGWLWTFERITA
jgi:hypothetical protein